MPIRLAVLCGLIACSFAITACGEDTEEKNDYVSDVNKAQQGYVAALSGFGADPSKFADDVRTLIASNEGLIKDLDALDPPEEVTSQHDKLVSSLQAFNAELEPLQADLASGDPGKVGPAAAKVSSAATKMGTTFDSTVNEINGKLHD